MAFRRSITARAKLLYQQPRVAAPFPHIHHNDNDKKNPSHNNTVFKNPLISDHFQRRLFGAGSNLGGSYRSGIFFQDRRFAIPAGCGPVFVRNMSTQHIEVMTEKAADVAAQVGPLANEVAIAAADSFMPVAAIQHLIDYVYCYTGFNWWASIVVTTILIRSIQLPVSISISKSVAKLRLLKPRGDEIVEQVENGDMTEAEAEEEMIEIVKEIGVTALKRLLVPVPIFCSFVLAVNNMAKNVPSFKEGGAFWFTDLTTPDSTFIFPILLALYVFAPKQRFHPEATAGTSKDYDFQYPVALSICLSAMLLPKAISCYWITNCLFSLAFRLVLKKPGVKEFLGFPIRLADISSNKNRSAAPTLRQRISYLEKEVEELKKMMKNL